MPIQLPSATYLFRQSAITIKRFPLEFAFTLIGTIAAILFFNNYLYLYRDSSLAWGLRFLMMGAIGLPLSFAATLFVENKALTPLTKISVKIFSAGIPIILLFALKPGTHPQDYVHFALIWLASHLLISFAAFTGTNNTLAFWEFNRALLSRLLLGFLYSLALALGLTAAFTAVNSLFGFHLEWSNLYNIWIITFGLFNTLFVLAGTPQHPLQGQVQAEVPYPKGLKFFSQYVLVPLATIYLVILLAYELKILIAWQLPNGNVSSLILGYAGIGILSLLLVHPIREKEGNGWVKVYSKYFYLFLLPLTVLLVLAVVKRIDTYGITQYRYFIIGLAVWLVFLIVYFLANKKATIKAIPISLFAVVLLIIYGPLSATAVSLRSQKAVLLNLFNGEKAVRNNKLIPVNAQKIKPYSAVRMASTVAYILKHYDFEALQPLLNVNLKSKQDSIRKSYDKYGNLSNLDDYNFKWTTDDWLQGYLGLQGYANSDDYTQVQLEDTATANYYIICKDAISPVKGYDYMLAKENYIDSLKTDTMAGYVVKQQDDFDQNFMILNIGTTKFKFPTTDLARQIIKQADKLAVYQDKHLPQGPDKNYILPQNLLILTQKQGNFEVMAKVQEMNFNYAKKDGIRISSVKAYYFIKIN